MAIQIINEINEKFLYESISNVKSLVTFIELQKEKGNTFKSFECSVDMRTYKIIEESKEEINILIDKELDLNENIKKITLKNYLMNDTPILEVLINTSKRITPEKIMEKYKEEIAEIFKNIEINLISSVWENKFKTSKKRIYEHNLSYFKKENDIWTKTDSKKRRTF